jgi:hypothetical protein
VTATTSIRWQAAERVVSLLRAEPLLANVTVEPGWPGDRVPQAELIWLDEIDGTVNIPVMTGGRKQRDDIFNLPFQIRVIGYGTLTDTMQRLTEIVATIEDTLADDTSLADLDGVLSAEVTEERQTSAMFPEGPTGFAEVVVTVSTRLL